MKQSSSNFKENQPLSETASFLETVSLPETISEQALADFKLSTSQLTTNNSSKIFQITSTAVNYSEFVTRTINAQASALPHQIDWHLENSSDSFQAYLVAEINQTVLNQGELGKKPSNDQSILQENELDIESFTSKYQNELEMMKFLRLLRYQHSCSIAILDLNNQISLEDSIERMSILAEVLIKLAYSWSFSKVKQKSGYPIFNHSLLSEDLNQLPQNMMILAMGKFGGFELNFSSDVDLIFFYGEDGETQGGKRNIENARFFQKVGVLVIKLLDEVTQQGFVFRVDMRLRPYGESGALAISLAQAEDYYQDQGRDWERFAMVRARVISGTSAEKECLEKIIRPFAFRRYIDYGVIDSLRNMKQMIQREVRRRELKNNIKLGAGGIREIEFMVQSLQLIQGGRNKKLQEKGILKVIPLLVEDKLLDENTAEDLATNYRFLRRLESCIQEFEEKQTQDLPIDPLQKKYLAEVMGFNSYENLKIKIDQHLMNTNDHFKNLFSEKAEEVIDDNDFYLSIWEGLITSEKLSEHFGSNSNSNSNTNSELNGNSGDFDFDKFVHYVNDFSRSKNRKDLSAKGSKRLTAIMPSVIELCINSSSPVNSIQRVINILKSILKRTAYLDLLVENRPILKHLIDLVSESEWIATRLSEHPILMDELLYPKSLYQPLKTHDLENELRQTLLRIVEDDEEALLNCIRQFKQINELRVAAALISQQLNISQVSLYLTHLAEVIISASIKQCWQIISSRHGVPENLEQSNDTGFAIIGYGKLGGSELGFNSDLDLVFLFDQNPKSKTNGSKPISVTRFYTRVSQKLIHFLSTRTNQGVLYEVDMRLRPSGNSGMLVSHIDDFKSYQKEEAWTWEHQALIRARCVFSGNGSSESASSESYNSVRANSENKSILKEFNSLRNEVINGNRIPLDLAADVSSMRAKMRQQLDKSSNERFDLKQGLGGLVDIEFLTQYYTLKNESFQCGNVPTNTNQLIKHLEKTEKISKETKTALTEAYNAFRNLINLKVLNNEINTINYKPVDSQNLVDRQVTIVEILKHQKMIKQIWLSEFE